MQSKIMKGLLAASCLVPGSLSMAAVTVNGAGAYATITQALSNASANAVLEITDSATYSENVHITLSGITLRAASGQTPTIEGIAAAHPVPASSMPTKWHGGNQDTTFNTNGATVVNSATNVSLQGLIISAGAADGALDLRFGTATVQNCTINATGKVAGILSLGDQTLSNVTVNGATDSIITQGAGAFNLTDSTVNGGGRAASFFAGTVNVSGSQLVDNATSGYGVIVGNDFGSISTNFDHVVFRSAAVATGNRGRILLKIDGTGTTAGNFPGATWGDGIVSFTANHCDFISPRDPLTGDFLDAWALNHNTGRLGWVMNNLTVTNSNFYGQAVHPINVGGMINEPNPPYGIHPDEINVDYNYFYKTRNNIHDHGDVLGNYGWSAENKPNNVQSWGPWDPLYVNPDAGLFQVASDSPAATAASNGGATGALGVGGAAVVTYTERTVAQSGGNFTSVQAAYDAAVNGDVITILDSATYNENLFFTTKKDIYLRAHPSLSAKPVISGTSAQLYTIKLATAGSQRVTIMGIAFDGANLPAGARAFQLEDAGQSAVVDCSFTTSGSTDWAFYITGTRNRIFTNCTIQHQTPGFGAVLQGGGTVDFENCTINSTVSGAGFFVINGASITLDFDHVTMNTRGPSVEQRMGHADIRNSHLTYNGLQAIRITGAANANFRSFETIFQAAGELAPATEQWGISTEAGTGDATIVVDNCDIYGSVDATVGFWMRNDGDRAVIKDSIVSNFSAFAFHEDAPGETPAQVYTGRAATYGQMNYNMLVNAPDPSGVAGTNSLNGTASAPHYVNAPADFRLLASSPAATLNSSGTPAYAGSQGVAPAPTAAKDWGLFQ